MSDQLFCIDAETTTTGRRSGRVDHPSWRLDENTKRIGRDGIAAARAALRATGSQYDHDDPIAA